MSLPKVPQFTALLERPQTGHGKALEEIHSGKCGELNQASGRVGNGVRHGKKVLLLLIVGVTDRQANVTQVTQFRRNLREAA